jgi:adenylylsulfate kinase
MKPCSTFWLLGPTSSGKTTIAKRCANQLRSMDRQCLHYDGDEIRDMFGPNFGFAEENRGQVVQTLTYFARKGNEAGVNVLISALTAHQSARDYVKNNLPNLKICYISCPVTECISRDPKGLYKKAISGEIETLVGYNSEYLPPDLPDITLETNVLTEQEASTLLLDFILAQ